jgi:hypothetical protein
MSFTDQREFNSLSFSYDFIVRVHLIKKMIGTHSLAESTFMVSDDKT